MNIREVKVFNESTNPLPKYETTGATGMDVSAKCDVSIAAGETKIVPTGLFMEIPNGCEILVFPRSGVSLKTSLRIANSVGKIDHDYRGELGVIVWNTGSETYNVKAGEKIAQITLYEPPRFTWFQVYDKNYLSKTERGENGFGSTSAKPTTQFR
jgi:dUTP pyrophosphatase